MKNRITITIIDENRRYSMKNIFTKDYEIKNFKSVCEVVDIIKENKFISDLIIFTIYTKDELKSIKLLKNCTRTPVVIINKTNEDLELEVFNSNADEYFNSKYNEQIFLARIKAILNRLTYEERTVEKIANISLLPELKGVKINSKTINFSSLEFDILSLLVKNNNKIVSREKIINSVWRTNYFGDSRTVDAHIKIIRKKLGEYRRYIKTKRSVGYLFECK